MLFSDHIKMRIPLTCFAFFLSFKVLAQIPVADFNLPSPLCLNQQVKPSNVSSQATNYQWDFCSGDLSQQPHASVLNNSNGGYGTRVKMIESDGRFFGFFISAGTRDLFRLDFGSNLSNSPGMTDLGNMGLNSNQLRAIDVIEENGLYFGFIVDSDKNKLYRIDFGNALTNTPQNAIELFSGAPLNTPYQLSAVSEGSLKFIFITNSNDGKIVRLKFNSYAGTVSESVSLPIHTNWLNSISFLKIQNTWHCAAVSPLTGEVLKIDFANGLDDGTPVVTSYFVETPMSVELVNENGTYYIFAQSRNPSQSLFRLNFGNDLNSNPVTTELTSLGYAGPEVWNFSMFHSKSTWVGFGVESIGSSIFRIDFPNNCFADVAYSTEAEPTVISSRSGSFTVTLTASHAQNNYSYLSKTVVVSGSPSSDIGFITNNVCTTSAINFTSINTSGNIITYNWSFGDAATSGSANPGHQYSAAGNYTVVLNVEASNGCKNYTEKTIEIYDPPIPTYTTPPIPVCTNNELTFTNATIDNFDGNLTYDWLINGVSKSSSRNLVFTFTTAGDQTVKLRTSIPGCTAELAQTFTNIPVGPVAGFAIAGQCQEDIINFSNTSTGAIAGYTWDFGNGQSATAVNPGQAYSNKGTYVVALDVQGTNGCISTAKKSLVIYSKPAASFSIDLPPFSCTGSPSQFNDLTPALTDSNVSSWLWNFGDAQNGNSVSKNPQYVYTTAGQFNVSLKTTTEFGCSATIQKQVTILQSPISSFTNTSACLNQATGFVDTSTGSIKSRLWKIGSNTYTASGVSNTFTATGNFQAQLTITGTNNCIAVTTKNINVPVLPLLDFSSINNCSGQSTVFTDITPATIDPVTTRSWDFAGQGTSTDLTTQHVFTVSGSYAVKMTATTQSGCTYPFMKSVLINKTPVAAFTTSVQNGPPPLVVQFGNTSTGASSYSWQFSDALNSTSTQASPSFTFASLGDYLVKLTATSTQGCKDITTKGISVIQPIPDLAIDQVNIIRNELAGTVKLAVSLRNSGNLYIPVSTLYVDASGTSLLKEIVGAIAPGQTIIYVTKSEFVLKPDQLKYVCAEISISDDRDGSNNKACVSVADELIYLPPYPNPSNGALHMDWIAARVSGAHVEIFNATGQSVYKSEIVSTREGLNQFEFDVSGFRAGTYILIVQIDHEKKSFRFQIL